MTNTNKIIEICKKKNIELPALKQLIRAEEENLPEAAERIGNNIIQYLKEVDLWRNSSIPPNRDSNPPRMSTIPPTKIY